MAEKFFRVLTIRSAGTTAQEALYPLLSPQRGKKIAPQPQNKATTAPAGPSPPPGPERGEIIAPERDDGVGLHQRYCRASRVTVSRIVDGQERPLLSLRRLNFLVYITGGRLVLACTRYPAATTLTVAGPGSGLAARGATAGRVNRQPGSVMVGHMRYSWIRSVSAVPRRWRFGRDTIVIEYSVPERVPMLLRLDLRSLPSGRTPVEMAAEICLRAVNFWQQNATNLPGGVVTKLAALAKRATNDLNQLAATGQAATGTAPPGRPRAELYRLPVWYPVTGSVPFFPPRQSRPPYVDYEGGDD